MKYDFDRVVDRRGTYSIKWEVEPGELPMWVADMDFQTAPQIMDAMRKRLEHGVYGYTDVPKEWNDAYINWWRDRHHIQIENDWIMFCTGVIPAISSTVRKLTTPGENVLVMTPVYNTFYNSILNNGRNVLECPLVYENHKYHIDYADLEKKLANPQTSLMILCNPHNPVGRVWTPEELWRIGDICLHNGVFVVADEIHCELVYEGHDYTPFASLSERFRQNSVTCVSPSKAFNLAGLQIANIIAADEGVRRRIDRAININEVCDVNPFGVIATIAAYNEGGAWLDALRKYLWGNYEYLCRFFEQRLPQYPVLPLEGTYLVWIDCRASSIGSDATTLRLQEEQKLMVNSGTLYGPGGEGFIRLNIACPRTLLADGLERIAHVLVQNF